VRESGAEHEEILGGRKGVGGIREAATGRGEILHRHGAAGPGRLSDGDYLRCLDAGLTGDLSGSGRPA
jgi:hypothetical protein